MFIGVQIFRLHRQSNEYAAKTIELNAEAAALSLENKHYQEEVRYYENPENVGKEALKYNRKKPGETLYILVPPKNEAVQ